LDYEWTVMQNLIEDFLQSGAQFTLLTRPRRFGKTLNLSMLQHFFAAQANRQPTQGLFAGLKIESRPIHGSPWEYQFFLDVQTDASAKLDAALIALTSATSFLRILGIYPPARPEQ